MKRIISIFLCITAISIVSGCSSSSSSDIPSTNTVSTTYTTAEISEEDNIQLFMTNNVENIDYCSATLADDKALLMCVLDKEMQDYKNNYYSFAESVIIAAKKVSKEYGLKYVNVNVYFFIDSDISIYWETTDFGETGTFIDKDDINNFKNVEYYSLSDLKDYLSKYN